MAKTKAEPAVTKTIAKKNKLKHKKPKPKNLKAVAASESAKPASKPAKPVPKPVKEVAKPAKEVSKPAKGVPKVKATPEGKEIDDTIPFSKKYPILANAELIKKFMSVTMTNNQKGRIRQLLKENLKGTAEAQLPDVINNKIQSIVKDSETHTDAELKRIRILYNMLKLSLQSKIPKAKEDKTKARNKIRKEKRRKKALEARDKENKDKDVNVHDKEDDVKDKKQPNDKEDVNDKKQPNVVKEKPGDTKKDVKDKVKGPKRYVVFVGNLGLDVDKEKLMKHFSEISDFVVDIRIPKPAEGKKSSIAYLELKNESSYELALSKHHTMLDNRRINVLYSTQQNSKITKTEAKSKSAKLIALQKSGKLSGSIPMNKKRSQRRMKAKLAQKKLEQS